MKANCNAITQSGTATTSFAQIGAFNGVRKSALIQNKGAADLYISVTNPNETPDINLSAVISSGAVWEPYRAPVGIISVATLAGTADFVYLID